MKEREGLVTAAGNGAWQEVACGDGLRLRVRFVAPGERVLVRERADDPGYGDLLRVLEPHPDRREPPCPHFGPCGGCQLQQLAPAAQLALKAGRVRSVLREAAGEEAARGLRAVASPKELAHRSRARFQATSGSGGLWHLGFHETGGRRTVDIPDCPLLAPELAAAWEALRPALIAAAPRGLTGLEVTALPGSDSVLVELNPRDRAAEPWPTLGEQLLERGAATGVATGRSRDDERARSVGETAALGRTPAGRPVAAALGGFVQANLAGADLLCDELLGLAEPAGRQVLELHAGAGLLSHALASAGAKVRAFELAADSVAAAQLLPEPSAGSLELRPGEADRAFEAHHADCELLVTDPPRSGLGELAGAIAARGPERMLGVWCSLDGLAQDLPRLLGAYELEDAVLVDLFPQTRHCEVLLALKRRD